MLIQPLKQFVGFVLDINDIDKVLDFIQEHLKYKDRELLEKYIKEHEKYGTIDYAVDTNGDIVGVVRWNMIGNVASVLDFAIKKEFRNKRIGTDFIIRAMMKFPQIEKIEFNRGLRKEDRVRSLSIKGIFKHNIF